MGKDSFFVVAAFAAITMATSPQAAFADGGRMLHLTETSSNDFDQSKSAVDSSKSKEQGAQRRAAASAQVNAVLQSMAGTTRTANGADGPGCKIAPASPSIGADIPEFYFGPAPSTVNPSLIGPLRLLTAGDIDPEAETIRLPLYRGVMSGSGESVYYILTDTTDEGNADALGLNFAPKLNYAATGRGARRATLMRDGLLVFDSGTVDFSPERRVVPGGMPPVVPNTVPLPFGQSPFPPSVAEPGSVGDNLYTPLVKIENAGGHVYNAPVIAFGVSPQDLHFPGGSPDYSLVHDKVLAIDTVNDTVTIALTPGFSFARPVLYLSTEASDPGVAALEGATFSPGLQDIETGNDDSAFSAVERIFVVSNGHLGCENPQRQGLNSAIRDGRGPFNVLGGIPTVATDYSPLWDVNLGEWTEESIRMGYRSRVIEEFQILGLVEAGFMTGPGGSEYGSIGVIVNCPIVFRFL